MTEIRALESADAPTVLVSGFEPFGAATRNVSAELVEALAAQARDSTHPFASDFTVRAIVLPVEYDEAPRRLLHAVREFRPQVVVAFGIHRDETIRLEQVARNRDHSEMPDNGNRIRLNRPIDHVGPDSVPTTLPLEAIAARLARHEFPFVRSESAGAYLCNHVFYHLCRWRDEMPEHAPAVCGFVHVPPLAEPRTPFSFADLARAGAWIVDASVERWSANQPGRSSGG